MSFVNINLRFGGNDGTLLKAYQIFFGSYLTLTGLFNVKLRNYEAFGVINLGSTL